MDHINSQEQREFLDILESQQITTVFQPIVNLKDGEVMGYEALSRGPDTSALANPAELFALAEVLGKSWELEQICLYKAMEKYIASGGDKQLFLNVNPRAVEDVELFEGFIKKLLAFHKSLETKQIIFELTESVGVSNYQNFARTLQHYTEQGFSFAIDDIGSGYSGLSFLVNSLPRFIKLDLELIRDIDEDLAKQNLIKSLTDFAKKTGITVIAEGIETLEELKTLIKLGVSYGQGYYLRRPDKDLITLDEDKRRTIRNWQQYLITWSFLGSKTVKGIVKSNLSVSPQTNCTELNELFRADPLLLGVAVVEKGQAIGLIMRQNFYSRLGTLWGSKNCFRSPIILLMDDSPLVIEEDLSIEEASRLAMLRPQEQVYDYILVEKHNQYLGIITVRDLLEKTARLTSAS